MSIFLGLWTARATSELHRFYNEESEFEPRRIREQVRVDNEHFQSSERERYLLSIILAVISSQIIKLRESRWQ